MSKPDYNNGFITALVLFYGHYNQWKQESSYFSMDMRLYGASDHLFDIEIPKNLDKKLKKRVENFRHNVLSRRLENISKEEAEKYFRECREILKEIDRKYFKIKRVVITHP